MATLFTKIKLYLEANSKTWEAEKDNIILHNHGTGEGDYIHTWNVSGLDKPNDSKIAEYETAGNTEESNNTVRSTRKKLYGDIGNQLDEIFKNIDDWKARIQSIKDANPKE